MDDSRQPSGWNAVEQFLGELTATDAPFEIRVGYGPTVSTRWETFSSTDGGPFWYAIGRFGQFEDTDAEPGVSLTSAAEAVADAVGEMILDLLVVQGWLEVRRSDSPTNDNEDEATGSDPR